MNRDLCSFFTAIATPADPDNGYQVTTTIGQIIKEHGKTFGYRPSLKKTWRDVKALADEGFIRIHETPPVKIRYGPFNHPLVISSTEKGRAHMAYLDTQEEVDEVLEPQIHLVPRSEQAPPAWLPKLDPHTKNLPPKPRAIVDVLQGLIDHSPNSYVMPSIKWILEKCIKWRGVKISRSQCFAWLAWLDRYGWLRRAPRKIQLEEETVVNKKTLRKGLWINKTTLYYIAEKAWAWAKRTYAQLRKHFAYTEVQDSGQNLYHRFQGISGERFPAVVSPTLEKQKGAAEAAGRQKSDLQKLAFSLPGILPKSGR